MKSIAMIRLLTLGLGLTLIAAAANAQHDSVTHLLRIYEDDDFINIWGTGSDDAYTNGTRIDYFYRPTGTPHSFTDRWMPKAGEGSIDIYSWGIAQLMYTPDDISNADYQPNDYPWSGELYASHALYSYNPVKQFDLQTELVLGVIGPAALDQQTQSVIHTIIQYYHPEGWRRQFRNDLLANINFTAEKALLSGGSVFTLIGGGQLYGGTMQNGAALYPLILIGKKDPYFNGFLGQYTSAGRDNNGRKKWQAYAFAKPVLQYFLSNAIVQGGMFTTNPNLPANTQPKATGADTTNTQPYHPLQHWVGSFTYGAVFSYGRIGLSLSQTTSAATLRGLYCHNYGNISFFFGW